MKKSEKKHINRNDVTKPKYSIVIPTYNHLEDCLKPCCEAIKKYTDLRNVEIVIVSNGSTDGTDRYVHGLGKPFRLESHSEPLGYSRACNKGIKVSRGEFIILLNNDAFLIEQSKNQWIEMLAAPFVDEAVGLTGPMRGWSECGLSDFLIFFCVMIRRSVFVKIGMLNEIYGMGGGEDTEFCIEAMKAGFGMVQVPEQNQLNSKLGEEMTAVGNFPIYHKGEATVHDDREKWNEVFLKNSLILAKKYNPRWYQWKLGNDCERAVFLKGDTFSGDFHRREVARYKFAAENLTGKKVLELGCSSGYGTSFLPKDIDYTGIDYDKNIIEVAQSNYGDKNHKFIHADVHEFKLDEHYDTIIAYEFLEHIADGRELAQKLKEHCDTLLATCPYREVPGVWGTHHKLHWLNEHDFPDFEYRFIQDDGAIETYPNYVFNLNLLLMKWQKGKSYPKKPRILCSVSTKDRYDMLALCVASIALQTRKPDTLIIYDDGEHEDLRDHPIYKHIFQLLYGKGIYWEVVFGSGNGPHLNHQMANMAGYDFVWRLDDDEIAEHDVLEKLLSHMKDDVGAVGGAVIVPGPQALNPSAATSKLEDIYHAPNAQWSSGSRVLEVDHLNSSFLYRAGIIPFCLDLSPVAHREETIFSHGLKRLGWKLIVDTSIITHHFRQDSGGIRAHDSAFLYEHDERIFASFMESWGYKLINLDVGLGDHLAFLNIVPALQKKYPHLIIGCCYPDMFKEIPGITTISVADSQHWCKDNIYKWMSDHQWKTTVVEAYAEMYGVKTENTDIPVCSKVKKRDAKRKDLSTLEGAHRLDS